MILPYWTVVLVTACDQAATRQDQRLCPVYAVSSRLGRVSGGGAAGRAPRLFFVEEELHQEAAQCVYVVHEGDETASH